MSLQEERKRARSIAFKFLAYKNRSVAEVFDHLEKKEISPDCAQSVVDELKELKYVNDAELARQWGRSRIQSRLWGSRRLQLELAQRGIKGETAASALRELYDEIDEFKIATACAEKKMRAMAHLDREKQRKRLAPYLERKGFPVSIIYAILQTPTDDD